MSNRAINLNHVLKYKLAAVLTSFLDEKSGELRISTSNPSPSENTRWKLSIPQYLSKTMWLLMDVPYYVCSNGQANDSWRILMLNFVKYATNKMNSYNGYM